MKIRERPLGSAPQEAGAWNTACLSLAPLAAPTMGQTHDNTMAREEATSRQVAGPLMWRTQSTEWGASADVPSEPQARPPLLPPAPRVEPREPYAWQLPNLGVSEQKMVTRNPDSQGQRDVHVLSSESPQASFTTHKPPHRCGHGTISSVLPELSLAPAVQRWGLTKPSGPPEGQAPQKCTVQCLLAPSKNHEESNHPPHWAWSWAAVGPPRVTALLVKGFARVREGYALSPSLRP